MPVIGSGVEEIRVSEPSGAYRVIYLARRVEAVYGCMPSTRKRRQRRRRILRSRRDDLRQLLEAGYEQTEELRECLGCDRGYPRAGCEPESAGRTDAEDRGTPEKARLDTG